MAQELSLLPSLAYYRRSPPLRRGDSAAVASLRKALVAPSRQAACRVTLRSHT